MALGAWSLVMRLSAAPSNATPLQFYPRLLAVWPLARWCGPQRGDATLGGLAIGGAALGRVVQLSAAV